MSATTTHTSNLTNEAGFPPAPSEAHQKAYAKGDVQEVLLNGTRIRMVFDGAPWWNVSVTRI
ncbi:hypothetical protein [Burkholderia sp. PAMC 26561]|jgi:hypothetical protein|uniref:hypothetical protein n=1 Tax=Burkholderiaceae TaxID=119060 RepID=UPI00076B3942|nr:hypothetical protein [Burkholderia sp. PAMC 26561]AME27359.1 hypothetical protein AXG89_26130 [Burkholderia sp. PAMC 26561]AME27489.1 hypothetical protein AXG89_26560 [Burkholderia sp. PAMC 26561]